MRFDPKLLVGGGLLLVFVLGVVWPSVAQAVMALAALFTAWIAWIGVSTWWRQIHGENTYDLAISLKEACGRFRDRVNQLRQPQHPSSIETPPIEENGLLEADAEAIHAAYEDRFHSAEEELSNLRNLVVRADSIWEDAGGLQAGFDDLSRMLQILDVNWRIHSRKLRTETEDDERWKSAREDLWGTGDRNVIGSVIDQKTAKIEQIADSKIEELRPTPGFPWPWS